MCAKFAFKFQAVAEKTAKNIRGYFILPHPVETRSSPTCVTTPNSVALNYFLGTL